MSDTKTSTPEFVELPPPRGGVPTPHRVAQGRTYPPQQQILLFSPEEWEEFILEWGHYQKTQYQKVVRLAGAGDMGIDVAAFTDDKALHGVWDCLQCKHYENPLTPATAYPEIAKILWYSFNKSYAVPRSYYFIAPKNCGPKLKKQLLAPEELKSAVISNWDKDCADAITGTKRIILEGDFLHYVNGFDFKIFGFKTALAILDEHKNSPYHAQRFGGGLPERPGPNLPPEAVQDLESRYIQQLYSVYSEETQSVITDNTQLSVHQNLSDHFNRQRECFYSAEALRNFARDVVPVGTFEDLQSEVYAGVIDIEQSSHASSMTRLNAVTQASTSLEITSNGLITVTKINDRKGICHQLANDDRLQWRK